MAKQPVLYQRIRRKSRKTEKNGPSTNKYAHLASPQRDRYDKDDKTFRVLPILGKPGDTIQAGFRVIFHGRLYELMDDVKIPHVAIVPGLSEKTSAANGRCKFIAHL